MSRLTATISAVVICLIVCLGWLASHYYDNATKFKEQRDKATEKLSLASATITDMQNRQRDVAALDARYTKELADAKATIESLSADVAAGKRRLYLNATCTGKADTATSPGMANAPAARPADSVARDYFALRTGIETVTKQVEGLQEYIREQCLK